VHCLKYGNDQQHVLGCEIVLMTGEVVRLGGKHVEAGGYDLLGIINGWRDCSRRHRGHVRILRQAGDGAGRAHRLLPAPRTPANASARSSGRDHPGGMEMMDKPAIHAVEEFVHAGYPLDVEALLIVELDGRRPRSTIWSSAFRRSRRTAGR